MRSTVRVVSAALAVTVLVAACGSDDSGTGVGGPIDSAPAIDTTVPETTVPDTTPETTPDTTADTAAPTSVPADAAQDVEADTTAAGAAVLVVADLPEGWTETPDDGASAPLEARLAECVGVDADSISASDAAARTGRFVSPDGNLTLRQHIGVQATERDAQLVGAYITEPAVPGCFEIAYGELAADALGASLAEGAQVGTPTVTRLQVGSAGDATQALRVTVPVTGDPSVTAVTVDHVIVRSGRTLTTLTFENRTEPTPVETIDGVTALVAERLPA